MLLVIGNKNYSSWSLRSWIALKMLGVPVDKKRIALRRPETKAEILRYSPAGRVPILRDGDTVVWGSLAILEYLAEKRPQLWPSDPAQRAKARSVAAVRRDPRERAACLTTLAECPLLAESRHLSGHTSTKRISATFGPVPGAGISLNMGRSMGTTPGRDSKIRRFRALQDLTGGEGGIRTRVRLLT